MSNSTDDPLHALRVAARKHGTLTRVAEMLSERGDPITKQGLNGWERIPAERCLALYQIIDGEVPLHRIRPDIYPDPAMWPSQAVETSRSVENV
mgnify:CR=1 FL=1